MTGPTRETIWRRTSERIRQKGDRFENKTKTSSEKVRHWVENSLVALGPGQERDVRRGYC